LRHRESNPFNRWSDAHLTVAHARDLNVRYPAFQRLAEDAQRLFLLSADHVIAVLAQQEIGIKPGIEAIEAN
jgi:hypothetical protein